MGGREPPRILLRPLNVTLRYEQARGRQWHPHRWTATITYNGMTSERRFPLYLHMHVGTVSAQKPYVLKLVKEWAAKYLAVTKWRKVSNDEWVSE